LADRACLALALDKSLPVLTTDRVWKKLKLDVAVQLVR
jgi:PIN domain nuclease of toxin-antitoxin system